jgi:type IV secretion system protein VirB6
MSLCPAAMADAGLVRDILTSVDCHVQIYALAGYAALTGPHSPLPAALTAMMTIYVALIGWGLLFGAQGPRLSETPLIAVKLGVTLTLTLSWSAFQTLVFDFDQGAPLQIARVISEPMALAEPGRAGDPVAAIQAAYDELTADSAELSRKAVLAGAGVPPPGQGGSTAPGAQAQAAAAAALGRAAGALLASTAGVLAVAIIATGVLTAVGPVFVALFLFDVTRGLFAGWLRALAAAMLAPLVCWVTTSLLLVTLGPRIDSLAQQRAAHAIDLTTAASAATLVMIFAAAQGLLVLVGLLIAGGFQLRPGRNATVFQPTDQAQVREARARIALSTRAQTSAREAARPGARPGGGGFVMGRAGAAAPAGRDGTDAVAPPRAGRLGEAYSRAMVMREWGRPTPERRA